MEGTGTAPRGHGARVPGTGSGTGFQFGPSYDIVMAVEIRVLVVLLGCKSGTCGPTLVERSENEAARYQCSACSRYGQTNARASNVIVSSTRYGQTKARVESKGGDREALELE